MSLFFGKLKKKVALNLISVAEKQIFFHRFPGSLYTHKKNFFLGVVVVVGSKQRTADTLFNYLANKKVFFF